MLILLGTAGCHLCEEAEQLLAQSLASCTKPYKLQLVDIAEQEQWQEEYAIRIPVLINLDAGNELGWPFGLSEIQAFLGKLD